MELLFILTLLFAVWASARVLSIEPKTRVNYCIAACMAILGMVAGLEYAITKVPATEAEVVQQLAPWHTFLNLTMVVITVWAGFYTGPKESSPKTYRISQFLLGSYTLLYVLLMFAQVNGDLVTDINHHMVNGQWYHEINNEGVWSIAFQAWIVFSVVMLSSFYYLAYRAEEILYLRQWKLLLFILFTLIPIVYAVLFVFQISPSHSAQYNLSPWFTLAMTIFVLIYTNFGLFNPVSFNVMDHLLDTVDSIVVVLEPSYRISYTNQTFKEELKQFGFKLRNHSFFPQLMVQIGIELNDEPGFVRQLRGMRPGDTIEQELPIRVAGQQRYYFVTITPIPGGNQQYVNGYVIVGKEISSLKKDELRMERYTKQLEQSNLDLERFAYIASHDLKTPVRNINSFANLLDRHLQQTGQEELTELSRLIISNATFMYRLIQNILEYSKVGKNPVAFEIISLQRVVERVEFELQELIQTHNAIIEYGELPNAYSTPSLMGSLLYNLIENAIKFNESTPPRIQISSYKDDQQLVISIKDNGIGIEPAFQKSIFWVFQRLHGYTDFRDTGVGLALCQRIVQLHGGSIWLTSDKVNGSTFFFSIPVKPATEDHLLPMAEKFSSIQIPSTR